MIQIMIDIFRYINNISINLTEFHDQQDQMLF